MYTVLLRKETIKHLNIQIIGLIFMVKDAGKVIDIHNDEVAECVYNYVCVYL